MRIAMVSEHASPLAVLGGTDAGGQNVHVAALSTELARHGHEVVVYTRRDDPALPHRVRLAPGVVVEHVDAGPPEAVSKDLLLPYMDDFAAELAAAWAVKRPDVVHAHFWMSARAALTAAIPLDVPVVQTFHALGVVKRRHQGVKDTSPGERLEEERRIIASADWIVATCSDEVFELVRLGADQRRISVVPCGVDVEHFTPRGPSEPRRPGLRRVLSVGRLVERKGFGNVMEAVARLPRVELIVAGGPERGRLADDPEGARLLRLAEDLGIADRVELRGAVHPERMPMLIRSADVVVSAPWYEPFGIVPLEAMACGVAVVASAVGGMIDTVVHRRTGLHVPPRRPEAIAAPLRELLGDDALRAALGAAGARRARTHYTWSRVAHGTLETYDAVVDRRSRPAVAQEARR